MNRAEKRRQQKRARKASGRTPAQTPGAGPDLLSLALQHHAAGRLAEAAPLYQKILQANPKQPVALQYLGVLAHQSGKNEIAVDLIGQAIAIQPDYAEAHSNLGVALNALGQGEAAVASYRTAIDLKPGYVEAHYNLGIVLDELGQWDAAIASYRQAIAHRPDYAQAYGNLGSTLRKAGQLKEAADCYSKVIAINPDRAETYSDLGVVLAAMGKKSDAADMYQKAITIQPDFAVAYSNLGNVLADLGQLSAAADSYRKAVALKPEMSEAHNNLASVLKDMGLLEDALRHCDRSLALNPGSAVTHSNKLLSELYRPDQTGAELYRLHRDWEARHGFRQSGEATAIRRPIDRQRRLRIGYVSADLRRHSVAFFLGPILASHDHQKFDIYCYSNSLQEDEVTGHLRRHATAWRSIFGVSDAAAAQMIGEDGIDILVDLSGHTMENRLPLFSRKPAPVQVTYLGYPATTGLSAIDYRLTDAWADPEGEADAWHSEQLVRLEGGFQVYQPPSDAPDIAPSPWLENGYITFGSCNNLAKITPRVVAGGGRRLKQVPTARMLLKAGALEDAGARAHILDAFASHGIAGDRLDLRAWISGSSPLEIYNHMDIALDTFPFNGATTTCETLWMGVPTLTLLGDHHAGRVGYSLNTRVGLDDWVAASPDAYVEKAVAAAADADALIRLRRDLRTRMQNGPLCDGPAFTRTLEAAYQKMAENAGSEAGDMPMQGNHQ